MVQIVAGLSHTCARTERGAVSCWGQGTFGALGDGTDVSRSTPALVRGLGPARHLAAADHATCAAGVDGRVRCWGTLSEMLPQVEDRAAPRAIREVPGVEGAVEVAISLSHGCARDAQGAVTCWGLSRSGEAGPVSDARLPARRIAGVTDAVRLLANTSTCAEQRDGTIVCWGPWHLFEPQTAATSAGSVRTVAALEHARAVSLSWCGDLFVDTDHTLRALEAAARSPESGGLMGSHGPPGPAVLGDRRVRDALAVACGISHGCALLRDHTVRCWGANDVGQLGDGTQQDRVPRYSVPYGVVPPPPPPSDPVQVAGLAGAIELAAGEYHTCARTERGAVWCWGSNAHGQLGDGGRDVQRTAWRPVVGLANVQRIAVDSSSVCAIDAAGAVACWGAHARLDNARAMMRDDSTPARVEGLPPAARVAYPCAASTTGQVHCWGDTGEYITYAQWSASRGGPVAQAGLAGVDDLVIANNLTCVLRRGVASCWGTNSYGQLGSGRADGVEVTRPQLVAGLARVAELRAYDYDVCARSEAGDVWCWGQRAALRESARVPVRMAGVTGAVALAVTNGLACAAQRDGATLCWGDANATASRDESLRWTTPTEFVELRGATQLALDQGHGCALRADGTLRCWGANRDGRVGDGTRTDRPRPVDVPGMSDVAQVEVGSGFTCARRRDGTVHCVGSNERGELGDGVPIWRGTPVAARIE